MENEKKESSSVISKSSLGMDENLVGLLCYLFGFITGIIFLVVEKESRFVKFHAMQSIMVSVALVILNMVLGLIPILGWIIAILIAPLSLVLWLLLMYKAYKHQWFKLPIIGEIADKQVPQA